MQDREKKLSAKQVAAINELLANMPIGDIAEKLDIAPSTLWRWQQDKTFRAHYREARNALMEESDAILQRGAVRAAINLRLLQQDESLPASLRIALNVKVIELARQGRTTAEMQELQEKLEEMESAIETLAEPNRRLRAV